MIEKRKPYRNKRILDAANGEQCLANFPGCRYTSDDVAFRHLNEQWAGKGRGQKADDCAGFFGCQHCENVYSGWIHNPNGQNRHPDENFYILRAYFRTIRRLIDKGVIR